MGATTGPGQKSQGQQPAQPNPDFYAQRAAQGSVQNGMSGGPQSAPFAATSIPTTTGGPSGMFSPYSQLSTSPLTNLDASGAQQRGSGPGANYGAQDQMMSGAPQQQAVQGQSSMPSGSPAASTPYKQQPASGQTNDAASIMPPRIMDGNPNLAGPQYTQGNDVSQWQAGQIAPNGSTLITNPQTGQLEYGPPADVPQQQAQSTPGTTSNEWGDILTQISGGGPIQTNFQGGGPVQNSFQGGGPVQSSFQGGGPLQRSVDLSGLGNYQTSANYGNIQNDLNLSNVPGLVSGDALRGMTTDAQNAAYKSATAYLDPQWQNQQTTMQNQLASQGVMQNSEAWNKAMDDFNRQKTFAYQQAENNAFGQGLNAQNQLFGQGLAVNQNQYNQDLGEGQFHNQSQAQGAQQAQFNAQLANFARQNQAQEAFAQGAFSNAAQGQAFGQNQAQAQFLNQAQQQLFGQNQAQGQFANQAQQQNFAQNMAQGQFANASQQQLFGQNLAQGQFTNAAQNQRASQGLQGQSIAEQLQAAQTMASGQVGAANANANASMTNVQRQIAAQQQQNDFLNSMAMHNQDINDMLLQQYNPWNLQNAIYGGTPTGLTGGIPR